MRRSRLERIEPARPYIDQNDSLSRAIIIDLDGTVALNASGRPFYGEGTAEEIYLDVAWTPTINFIQEYCDSFDAFIIVVTGRHGTESVKRETFKWLSENGIDATEVYFRHPNDYRKSDVVKTEIFNNHLKDRFHFDFVLEDSHKCVMAWRKLGLLCFQVWDCE